MLNFTLPDIYELISHYFWPMLRVLALITFSPVFSERTLGRKVKIGLAMMIAFLFGQNLPDNGIPIISADGLLVAINQIIIGSAIGLTIQFVFAAVRMAGEVIGLQMGLSFASFFDPSSQQNMPVIASLLNLLGTLLFLALNGHLYLIKILAETFTVLPVNASPMGAQGFMSVVRAAGIIFQCGLMLGLPLITLLLALNLTLGILNRLTPQLSVFVIGFPISITVGLIAFSLVMYTLAPVFEKQLINSFDNIEHILIGFI